MNQISLIAAVDKAWGIGCNNQLLAHLPADLNHFKSITMGKPIIMGRRTYESIGKPLPGRTNIVLSSTLQPAPQLLIVPNLAEALTMTEGSSEVLIIGGARLFQEGLNYASRLYLTQIHHQFKADVFFPTIDLSNWQCKEQHLQNKDSNNQYDMTFFIYERITIGKNISIE